MNRCCSLCRFRADWERWDGAIHIVIFIQLPHRIKDFLGVNPVSSRPRLSLGHYDVSDRNKSAFEKWLASKKDCMSSETATCTCTCSSLWWHAVFFRCESFFESAFVSVWHIIMAQRETRPRRDRVDTQKVFYAMRQLDEYDNMYGAISSFSVCSKSAQGTTSIHGNEKKKANCNEKKKANCRKTCKLLCGN